MTIDQLKTQLNKIYTDITIYKYQTLANSNDQIYFHCIGPEADSLTSGGKQKNFLSKGESQILGCLEIFQLHFLFNDFLRFSSFLNFLNHPAVSKPSVYTEGVSNPHPGFENPGHAGRMCPDTYKFGSHIGLS